MTYSPIGLGQLSIVDQLRERKRALTVNELATLLSVNQLTIYRLCSNGRLPHFKVGAAIRFCPATVAAWLKDHAIG